MVFKRAQLAIEIRANRAWVVMQRIFTKILNHQEDIQSEHAYTSNNTNLNIEQLAELKEENKQYNCWLSRLPCSIALMATIRRSKRKQ